MIADKKLESLENCSARLTVTVDKEAATSEYSSLLKKYSLTAQIKGFRRGKVPPNILEQKFGESIRSEAGLQLIESSLKEVFEDVDEKPLQFEPPELEGDVDLELGKDFTFTVTYDVFPKVEIGEYKGIEIEEDTVSVASTDIDRELEVIRERNAIVVDKPDDAVVENDDIVTIDYEEVDENDETIEGTTRSDFAFTVGSAYNRYKIDEDILGLKKEDAKIVEKTYKEDFEDSELAGRSVRLSVHVKQIKRKDKPELDDELAQDVSDEYKTLEDLKKDIRKQLRDASKGRLRQRTIQKILESIVDASPVVLPESMLRAELQSNWSNFLARSGLTEEQMMGILSNQERTQDDLFEEWKPQAERTIRTRLAMNEIIEKEKIESTEDELDEAIKEQALRSNMDVETARANLEQAQMLDYLRSQIVDRKLTDFLFDQAKKTKGKKLKLLDLLQDNQ